MKKYILTLGTALACLTMGSVANADIGYGGACGAPCGAPCGSPCGSPCGVSCDPCCNDFSFSGFYIGGNVGVITFEAARTDLNGLIGGTPTTFVRHDTSVCGGFQIGYDWQCCNRVLGLVWDWDWTNTRVNNRLFTDSATRIDNRLRWFTTIRARAGVAVCDVLFYITGGAAGGQIRSRNTFDGVTDLFRTNRTRWGWTGGVGAEFVLGCNFTLNAELLYLNFGSHTVNRGVVGATEFRFHHSDQAWLGRIGLNYRFGCGCGCW